MVGHVFLTVSLRTILADQISVTDFCQGTILIQLANCLTYNKIILQGAIINNFVGTHLLGGYSSKYNYFAVQDNG